MYLCCFLLVRMKRGRGLFGTFRQNSEFSGLCINFLLYIPLENISFMIWRVTIGYNNLFLKSFWNDIPLAFYNRNKLVLNIK